MALYVVVYAHQSTRSGDNAMVYQPVPNTCQLAMIFTQDGQRIENVFHLERDVPWDEARLIDLADNAETIWHTNIAPRQVNNASLSLIIARSLESDGAPAVERSGSTTGNLVSQELPTNVTVAIKWTTGLAGRSFRGRTYHIGLGSGDVSASLLTATAAGLLLDAYANWQTDIQAHTASQMVVVSRVHNGLPRPEGITTAIRVPALADLALDNQRRRLPTRGD